MAHFLLVRRGAALLLIVFLFTALGACRQRVPAEPNPTEPVQTETPGGTEPENPEPEEPASASEPVVGASTYDKTFYTEDGTKLLSLSYAVPKIENAEGNDSLTMINAYYEAQLQAMVDAGRGELLETAEIAAQEGYLILPYSEEESFTEEYRSESRIAFLRTRSIYNGGAHPNFVLFADNFDYTTGLRLTAEDVFSVPEDIYRTRILDEILKQIEKNGAENYFEEYREYLPQIFNPDQFYLTEEGIVYYFQPYDIAPYAAGVPSFLIPFSAMEDILEQWT